MTVRREIYKAIRGYDIIMCLASEPGCEVFIASRPAQQSSKKNEKNGIQDLVILKVLSRARAQTQLVLRDYLFGAARYIALVHQHLLRLYDVFSDGDDRLIFVVEYTKSLSLPEFLTLYRHKILEPASVSADFHGPTLLNAPIVGYLALSVFSAIAATHQSRDLETGRIEPVAHGQITSSSILILLDGTVKLANFQATTLLPPWRNKLNVMAGVRDDIYAACTLFRDLFSHCGPTDPRLSSLLANGISARTGSTFISSAQIYDQLRHILSEDPGKELLKRMMELLDIVRLSPEFFVKRGVLTEWSPKVTKSDSEITPTHSEFQIPILGLPEAKKDQTLLLNSKEQLESWKISRSPSLLFGIPENTRKDDDLSPLIFLPSDSDVKDNEQNNHSQKMMLKNMGGLGGMRDMSPTLNLEPSSSSDSEYEILAPSSLIEETDSSLAVILGSSTAEDDIAQRDVVSNGAIEKHLFDITPKQVPPTQFKLDRNHQEGIDPSADWSRDEKYAQTPSFGLTQIDSRRFGIGGNEEIGRGNFSLNVEKKSIFVVAAVAVFVGGMVFSFFHKGGFFRDRIGVELKGANVATLKRANPSTLERHLEPEMRLKEGSLDVKSSEPPPVAKSDPSKNLTAPTSTGTATKNSDSDVGQLNADCMNGLGTIETKSAPKQFRIYIDGRVLGETPNDIKLRYGKHKVKIGSKGKERSVYVPCGGSISLGLTH